jgi:hypothetical protein
MVAVHSSTPLEMTVSEAITAVFCTNEPNFSRDKYPTRLYVKQQV